VTWPLLASCAFSGCSTCHMQTATLAGMSAGCLHQAQWYDLPHGTLPVFVQGWLLNLPHADSHPSSTASLSHWVCLTLLFSIDGSIAAQVCAKWLLNLPHADSYLSSTASRLYCRAHQTA
jgi:hypothetical protein